MVIELKKLAWTLGGLEEEGAPGEVEEAGEPVEELESDDDFEFGEDS